MCVCGGGGGGGGRGIRWYIRPDVDSADPNRPTYYFHGLFLVGVRNIHNSKQLHAECMLFKTKIHHYTGKLMEVNSD